MIIGTRIGEKILVGELIEEKPEGLVLKNAKLGDKRIPGISSLPREMFKSVLYSIKEKNES